ncbi:DUF1990 family protein, partial [Streptomyces chryseus]
MATTRGEHRMNTLNYPETGATRQIPLPAGYHHLRHRTAVGTGRGAGAAGGGGGGGGGGGAAAPRGGA